MSKGDDLLGWRFPMPECCQQCKRARWELGGEYQAPYPYCKIGVWMPYKKKSCKRQDAEGKEGTE